MTYSAKFTGATRISAFAIGVKFKGLNAVPGHARHLGHRYSPAISCAEVNQTCIPLRSHFERGQVALSRAEE